MLELSTGAAAAVAVAVARVSLNSPLPKNVNVPGKSARVGQSSFPSRHHSDRTKPNSIWHTISRWPSISCTVCVRQIICATQSAQPRVDAHAAAHAMRLSSFLLRVRFAGRSLGESTSAVPQPGAQSSTPNVFNLSISRPVHAPIAFSSCSMPRTGTLSVKTPPGCAQGKLAVKRRAFIEIVHIPVLFNALSQEIVITLCFVAADDAAAAGTSATSKQTGFVYTRRESKCGGTWTAAVKGGGRVHAISPSVSILYWSQKTYGSVHDQARSLAPLTSECYSAMPREELFF